MYFETSLVIMGKKHGVGSGGAAFLDLGRGCVFLELELHATDLGVARAHFINIYIHIQKDAHIYPC